jgi:hypothetical protein
LELKGQIDRISKASDAAKSQMSRDENEKLTLRATIKGLAAKEAQLTAEIHTLKKNAANEQTKPPPSPPRRAAAPPPTPSHVHTPTHDPAPTSPEPQLEYVANVPIVDPTKPIELVRLHPPTDEQQQQQQTEEARGEGAFQPESPAIGGGGSEAPGMHPLLVPVNAVLYGITLGNMNAWGGGPDNSTSDPSQQMNSERDLQMPHLTPEQIAERDLWRKQKELSMLQAQKPPRPDGARDVSSSAPLKGILKRTSVTQDSHKPFLSGGEIKSTPSLDASARAGFFGFGNLGGFAGGGGGGVSEARESE